MQHAAKIFARKVLLLHLLLLLLVVIVVVGAAGEVYKTARTQAIDQARGRQELLARQTARGIESYYQSIISDLELLQRSEADATGTNPDSRPLRDRIAEARKTDLKTLETRPVPVNNGLAVLIWRQLQGRASHLFTVDHRSGNVVINLPSPEATLPKTLAKSQSAWLKSLEDSRVSRYIPFESGGGQLIAVPGIGGRPGGPPIPITIVAIVPIEKIKTTFFDPLNKEGDISAVLVDEAGVCMVALDPRVIGRNVSEIDNSDAQRAITDHILKGINGTAVIETPAHFGPLDLPPRVAAAESIQSLPGRRWTVVVMSPLADVNAVITPLFERIVMWAIFVVIAVTGILVSTAIQMIRSRMRVERIRHDLLQREINQARQIQLAWLPSKDHPSKAIDIAALNHPANHISGDFYNWFDLPDGRIAVCIGDVTGHGMAAAFLMATTQLLIRTTLPRVRSPGECLEEVNRQLCIQAFAGQFVTILLMIIDEETGEIELATAGHFPPLISTGDSHTSLPMDAQLVLGVDPDEHYPTQRHRLEPESTMLLYTDGVLDAQAPTGQRFGLPALQRCLASGVSAPQVVIDQIIACISAFRGERELADDLTLVAIQFRAALARPRRSPVVAK